MVGGGDMAAGYLLAKAIPAAQFQRWMKAAADGSLSRIDLMEIQSAAMKARNVTRAAS
jgi:thymidine phosphorylase